MFGVELKNIVPIAVILLVGLLLFGCTANNADLTALAQNLPALQGILKQYPNADIKVVLVNAGQIQGMQDTIKTQCGIALASKDYYAINVNDPSTKAIIVAYISADSQQLVCAYKQGSPIGVLDQSTSQIQPISPIVSDSDANTVTISVNGSSKIVMAFNESSTTGMYVGANYRNAYWQCYDGNESYQGEYASCKPVSLLNNYAQAFCEYHCSTQTGKCGVNTFYIANPCTPDSNSISGGCSKELRACSDGSGVGRNPDLNCDFNPCPTDSSGCSKELMACSDGSGVGRNPDLNCDFNPCPTDSNSS